MEDDNLLYLLNQYHDGPKATTPIQPRREPLGEIVENDDHSSIVTMTCLNDRVPSDKVKRHFDDIRLVRSSCRYDSSRIAHETRRESDRLSAPSRLRRQSQFHRQSNPVVDRRDAFVQLVA